MAHMVETMFSVRETPWHGLGKVIENAPNSLVAIQEAGLDWDVVQEPIYLGDSTNAIEGHFANVRNNDCSVLGVVSSRYTIVQNAEAFAFTDALVGNGDVRYETAGSLKGGRKVWMLARMNREYDIMGDKVDPYICFTNTHDGSGAVRVLMTPVRVVCNNTLNMALDSAKRQWSTFHVGDVSRKLVEAQRTLLLADEYLDALNENANLMADVKLTEFKVRELVNNLIPIDEKATERAKSTAKLKQQGILQAYKAEDIKQFRGTGWGFLNAVADFVGHAEPTRNTDTFTENRFSSIIRGDNLFDEATALLRNIA
ncbi:DUF932 domain-containing protein [Alicyclobacillus sp. ALC3]|uniref:DUF932 domain-containing protein n=1 Tax=Alicyclobacillus sp. ALC3 TaxID=2796143 RepID=UPI002379B0A0|nr:DUF932 domain-containing protein [Alicyclobacillus sp. ALC3]WDL98104.1 DUF932 domain-containing protein [Alicyclobacillus sp. ALC3]